jgi:hypothetical protein
VRIRQRVPSAVERNLRHFYGDRSCLVTRIAEDAGTVWHHLDENASRSAFDNIVPLSAGLNQAIEGHRRSPDKPLPQELKVESLRGRGEALFERAEMARAYGIGRLGAFLFLHDKAEAESVALFAADGLHSARALDQPSLAADILTRNVLPLFEGPVHRLSGLAMGLLALEVACVFWDYAAFDDFTLWSLMCRTHLDPARAMRAAGIGRVRLQWKTAVVGIANHRPGATDALSQLESTLDSRTRYTGSINIALWSARSAIKRREYDKADHLLKPFVDWQRLGTIERGQVMRSGHWWSVAESALTMADLHRRWEKRTASEYFDLAVRGLQVSRLRPTLVDGMHLPILEHQARHGAAAVDHIVIREPAKLNRFRQQATRLFDVMRSRTLRLP